MLVTTGNTLIGLKSLNFLAPLYLETFIIYVNKESTTGKLQLITLIVIPPRLTAFDLMEFIEYTITKDPFINANSILTFVLLVRSYLLRSL